MATTQQEAMETTAASLVQKARELAPRLRERVAQTEALRSLPVETVQDLRASGLLRVQKPVRYGGYQLGYDVLTDIFIELAQGCASTSWVSMILNSAGIVAGFPEQAQEELWGSGEDNLVCGVFSAVPTQVVDGGYRLSGSWLFASGIDHADWLFLGGLVPGGGGTPDMRFFLLSKSEISVVDDWFVLGLRGTGSKKVVANDVFIPTHRSVSMALLRDGNSPGASFHDAWLYRIPLAAVYHTSAVGPAIGAAKGALRDYTEWTRTRKGSNMRPLIENAEAQIHLAESSADIDVAERIIRADIAEVMALVSEGRSIDPLERARYHRDAVFCSALCVRAIDRLFEQSGGSALHDEHPVQRVWRDIHAAAAHHSNRWDSAMQHYGRLVFGLGSANPFFY